MSRLITFNEAMSTEKLAPIIRIIFGKHCNANTIEEYNKILKAYFKLIIDVKSEIIRSVLHYKCAIIFKTIENFKLANEHFLLGINYNPQDFMIRYYYAKFLEEKMKYYFTALKHCQIIFKNPGIASKFYKVHELMGECFVVVCVVVFDCNNDAVVLFIGKLMELIGRHDESMKYILSAEVSKKKFLLFQQKQNNMKTQQLQPEQQRHQEVLSTAVVPSEVNENDQITVDLTQAIQ